MSVKINIKCDNLLCGREMPIPATTVRNARAGARAIGWMTNVKQKELFEDYDLCPACAKLAEEHGIKHLDNGGLLIQE